MTKKCAVINSARKLICVILLSRSREVFQSINISLNRVILSAETKALALTEFIMYVQSDHNPQIKQKIIVKEVSFFKLRGGCVVLRVIFRFLSVCKLNSPTINKKPNLFSLWRHHVA